MNEQFDNQSNGTIGATTSTVEKNNKKLFGILGGIGGFIILCVCLILFVPAINNFVCKTCMSPKSYLEKVEKNDIDTKTEQIKKAPLGKEFTLAKDECLKESFDIKISEKSKELLGTLLKKELKNDAEATKELSDILNSVTSISADGFIKNADDNYSGSLTFKINDNELIKALTLIDFKEKTIYLQIPTISDKWLSIIMPEEIALQLQPTMNPAMMNEKAADIMKKYTTLAIENINEVKKDTSSTIKVDGNEVKCTLLKATINDKDGKEMSKAILKEAKDDKDLYDLLKDSSVSYEDYQKTVQEQLDKLDEDSDTSDSNCIFKAWVDGKGTIIGNEIAAKDMALGYQSANAKKDSTSFSFYVLEKDKKIMNLEGTSSQKNDATSGKSKLTICDDASNEDFCLDFDYSDLKVTDAGMLNGHINISSDSLFTMDMTLNSDDKSQSTESKFTVSSIEIATITSTTQKANASDVEAINKPTDSITVDLTKHDSSKQLEEYTKTIKLDKIADTLKKTFNNSTISAMIDAYIKNPELFKSSALTDDKSTNANEAEDEELTDEELAELADLELEEE